MDLFYLRHHWISLRRDPSGSHYLWIGVLVFFMLVPLCFGIYSQTDHYLELLQRELVIADPGHFCLLLMSLFWLTDLLAKVLMPKAAWPLKPYMLLNIDQRGLIIAYLALSVGKFWNLVLVILQVPVLFKLYELTAGLQLPVFSNFVFLVALFWLLNHFMAVFIHLSGSKVRYMTLGILVASFYMIYRFGAVVPGIMFEWALSKWLLSGLLIVAAGLAYRACLRFITHTAKVSADQNSSLGSFYVNISEDPLIQLEWALITRNKRAYTNFIAGLLAIPYFFFIMSDAGEGKPLLMVVASIVLTGFTLLQHGTYTLAWEGGYFDLLMTRVSIRSFLNHKYKFFIYSGLITLVICMIFTIGDPVSLLTLTGAFLFNMGWNLPMILNNSVHNTTKLDLGKGTFFNYQGLNGTLFATSMFVMLVPMTIFILSTLIFGDITGRLAFAAVGLSGLLLKPVFIRGIEKKYRTRKYHLSNCYRN